MHRTNMTLCNLFKSSIYRFFCRLALFQSRFYLKTTWNQPGTNTSIKIGPYKTYSKTADIKLIC